MGKLRSDEDMLYSRVIENMDSNRIEWDACTPHTIN